MSAGLDITSLDFDPVTPESAQFTVAIPDTWDLGEIGLEIHWSHGAGASAFAVVWKVYGIFLKDGLPILGALSNVVVEDEGGTANRLYISDRAVLIPAGPREGGGLVGLIIQRAAADPADTLDVDARLLGVRFLYTALYANENTRQVFLPDPSPYENETEIWRAGALAAGGTFESNSVDIADQLIRAIQAATFNSKIKYLLPLLGSNLASARMPLRDSLGKGIATNRNFVDGDFGQGAGLIGDGLTKSLNSLVYPSELGPNFDGGLGFWERNFTWAVGPAWDYQYQMGARPAEAFGQYTYHLNAGVNSRAFGWGHYPGDPTLLGTAISAHYYGQRLSAGAVPAATVRKLYQNAVEIASVPVFPTVADPNYGYLPITIMGEDQGGGTIRCYKGRCAVAYMTDGSMTPTEITDFHTLLGTYLITPTGR